MTECVSLLNGKSISDESRSALSRAFNALPMLDRQLLALHYGGCLSTLAIGDALALPKREIEHSLARALLRVQAAVRREGLAIPPSGEWLHDLLTRGRRAPQGLLQRVQACIRNSTRPTASAPIPETNLGENLMPTTTDYDYSRAFARNIGLVSESEQEKLKQTCIALPGLGGVGGAHLQTLVRMGIGAFHLADPDTFDVVNFNRQLGANLETVGRNKAEVMAEVARSINPGADVRTFSSGIDANNIAAFLDGVDVVVDGIEFFCLEARRMLYRVCRERRIPVVTAGPIGFGAAVLVFMPGGATFEEHFGIDNSMTRAEQLLGFALGLTPGMISDVDPTRIDVQAEKGPALASACMLCAATAATEVLKLVCQRGVSSISPHGVYFDPYRGRTFKLRPTPHLHSSLRGRVLRWMAFRRFPAFLQLHEQELAARKNILPAAHAAKHLVN